MQNTNWAQIEDAKDFPQVTAGGYICKITGVEDIEDKEYLKIEADIAEGEFKSYYRDLYTSKGFWGLSFIKSYKEKAMPFFAGMLTAFENSNSNFKKATFDNQPEKLRGLTVGLVLAYEQYKAKDKTVKTRLYVAEVRSVGSIKKKDFIVPELKLLSEEQATTNGFSPTPIKAENIPTPSDDDLPF